MHFIEFSPPMLNLVGTFNTFRLGLRYSKLLKAGDTVLLLDKSKMTVLGKAKVTSIEVGNLRDMANAHAHQNHNQKGVENAPDALVAAMIRRYGPHKVDESKKVTVIGLKFNP